VYGSLSNLAQHLRETLKYCVAGGVLRQGGSGAPADWPGYVVGCSAGGFLRVSAAQGTERAMTRVSCGELFGVRDVYAPVRSASILDCETPTSPSQLVFLQGLRSMNKYVKTSPLTPFRDDIRRDRSSWVLCTGAALRRLSAWLVMPHKEGCFSPAIAREGHPVTAAWSNLASRGPAATG
jgi:hypothetical protein